MLHANLRRTVAVGSVAVLLLAEFSLFHDFFYPFRYLWSQDRIIEFFLSLILFVLNRPGFTGDSISVGGGLVGFPPVGTVAPYAVTVSA